MATFCNLETINFENLSDLVQMYFLLIAIIFYKNLLAGTSLLQITSTIWTGLPLTKNVKTTRLCLLAVVVMNRLTDLCASFDLIELLVA